LENTFYTDVVADTYAAEKVLDDTKVAIIRKTIALVATETLRAA
jgi:hypothetical protein